MLAKFLKCRLLVINDSEHPTTGQNILLLPSEPDLFLALGDAAGSLGCEKPLCGGNAPADWIEPEEVVGAEGTSETEAELP